ncbi:PaeR7I family type II restriction endonuclease [Microcoleus sp. B7-D4]|uniref:PaeR7I family type II restriction endonuclease n=1 Tax=Microcoleus sp. B7-D4 TaxID=2818696 RepID=UPI004040B854
MHKPVGLQEPHFKADPVFTSATYAQRYEILCRRLVLERHYDAACLALSTNATPTGVSHPSGDLAFTRFVRELQATATRFLET